MSAVRRIVKNGLIALAVLLLVLALVVAGSLAFLRTEGGRDWAAAAARAAAATAGMDLRITGLREGLPGTIAAARVVVADREGPWLELDEPVIEWRPLALAGRLLDLERVAAERVRVLRRPETRARRARTSGEPGMSLSLPTSPVRLRLGRLALPEVTLDPPVLGAPAAFSVEGGGEGAGWSGGIEGRVGEATTELRLELDARTTPVLRVSGHMGLAPVLPARLGALFAGGAEVSASLAGRGGGAELRDLRIETDALAVSGGGQAGQDGELDVRVRIERVDEGALAEALAPVGLAGLSGRVSLSGRAAAPRVSADLEAAALTAPDFEAGGLSLAAVVAGAGDGGGVSLELDAAARSLHWTLEGADPLIRGPATLAAAGRLTSGGRLELNSLEAALPDITVAGSLALDPSAGTLGLPARVEIRDLAALRGLTRLDLAGAGTLDATLTLPAFDGRVVIETEGRLRDFDPGIPVVDRFAAEEVTLAAALRIAPETGLAVTGIELSGPRFVATGEVRIPRGYEQLEVNAEARLPDASVLSPALGVDLEGVAWADARVTGPLGNPGLSGDARVDGMAVAGERLRDVRAAVSLSDLAGLIGGRVRIEAESAYGPASLDTRVAIGEGRVRLREAALAAGPGRATGELVVPYSGPPVSADLRFEAETVAPFLARLGLEGDAALRGRLGLGAQGTDQSGDLNLSATGLSLGGEAGAAWEARRLEAAFRASGFVAGAGRPGDGALSGSVTLEGLARPGLRLDLVQADLDGTAEGVELSGSASGEAAGEPLSVDARLAVAREGTATVLRLRRLDGRYRGLPVTLRQEAVLGLDGSRISLQGLAADVGEGSLRADARLGVTDGYIRASGEGLPASLLGIADPAPALSGSADLRLDLAQDGGETAAGMLELDLRDIRLADQTRAAGVQGGLQAGFGPEGLALTATASGPVAEPVTASGRLPLWVDLARPALRLDRDAAMEGRLRWAGRAGRVLGLLPMGEHLLDGNLEASVRVAGTPAEPAVSGRVTLEDGRYEHLTVGTLLQPLAFTVEGHGEELRLTRFEASDGADGRVMATGQLLLDPARSWPMDVEVRFDEAVLVRRDEVTAQASGRLSAGREGGRTRLFGRIETDEVEARLVGRLPPEVVELDVVETGAAGEPDANGGTANGATPGLLTLDVQVVAPRRFFLRGRGLDSEWRGDLSVRGTAAEPVIEGTLRSVRGIMVILGKRFELGASAIRFRGGREINPELDIVATYDGPDLTVTARLAGPVSRPEISLESSPSLPEDEILARTLFGKSAAELSALEAVQLAAAVGELYGVSGGGGLLERARSVAGVDVLRVGTAGEEGGATVEAGKYVSEGVYLGVQQGSAAQSGAVSVEVEVTPNILLRSNLREDGRSNVGVEFKRDY